MRLRDPINKEINTYHGDKLKTFHGDPPKSWLQPSSESQQSQPSSMKNEE